VHSKPRNKIAMLPYAVRQQVNEKLRDNPKLWTVAEWLFGLSSEEGVPYSTLWERRMMEGPQAGTPAPPEQSRKRALHNCECGLSKYRKSPEYLAWLDRDKTNGVVGQLVTNLGSVTRSTSDGDVLTEAQGINRLALSIFAEQLEKFAAGKGNAEDAAAFGEAAVKLTNANVSIERARLDRDKFKKSFADKVELGLQAVFEQIKANPAAVELFNQMRAIVQKAAAA
jgi:hypothetical protein